MIDAEEGYDYYAEKIALLMEESRVLDPEEKKDFIRYVRGY
jgi:hypothetical protein